MLLKHIFNPITCKSWLMVLLLTGALVNCSTPTKDQQSTSSNDSLGSITQKRRWRNTSPCQRTKLINIAQRLLSIGEPQQAVDVIELIEPTGLSDSDYIAYVVTAGDIYSQKHLFKARTLLSTVRSISYGPNTSDQQKHLHLLRADIYQQTGQTTDSLNERIALATLLSDKKEIHK